MKDRIGFVIGMEHLEQKWRIIWQSSEESKRVEKGWLQRRAKVSWEQREDLHHDEKISRRRILGVLESSPSTDVSRLVKESCWASGVKEAYRFVRHQKRALFSPGGWLETWRKRFVLGSEGSQGLNLEILIES